MVTAEDIRQKLAPEGEALRRYKVARLWLFGSAARGESIVHDLDFMVEFTAPPGLVEFMELKFFLEETLERPVDLHSLASCPPRFLKRIESDLKHVA